MSDEWTEDLAEDLVLATDAQMETILTAMGPAQNRRLMEAGMRILTRNSKRPVATETAAISRGDTAEDIVLQACEYARHFTNKEGKKLNGMPWSDCVRIMLEGDSDRAPSILAIVNAPGFDPMTYGSEETEQ